MENRKTSLLFTGCYPEDLSHMNLEKKKILAQEIRDFLLSEVPKQGGHLSSNLGVVELSLALLSHFNPLESPIIFDVGHQSYVYKILTKRLDKFSSLRKKDGLAGFPKREESKYDAFNTGHSSTAISAALGIQRASRLRGKPQKVLAFMGDGAMTGGMCFEALNNVSPEDDVLIILNDNEMSISPNVGGLNRFFGKFRLRPQYLHTKREVKAFLDTLPFFNRFLLRFLRAIKKHLLWGTHSQAGFFDTLGWHYYGPVDGHDLESLDYYLEHLKNIKGPRILHVYTQKGKGYEPAERDSLRFHGLAPQTQLPSIHSIKNEQEKKEEDRNPCSRQALDKKAFLMKEIITDEVVHLEEKDVFYQKASFTEVFSKTLCEIGEEEKTLCAITAAMLHGTGLLAFSQCFPQRCYDVGIAEQHATSLAAALALYGAKPVLALYSTFLQRAIDQIIHDICLQNAPVLLAVDRAGLVGADGETHQGIYDLAFLSSLPNIEVYSPMHPASLARLLHYHLEARVLRGPIAIRYPRGKSSYNEKKAYLIHDFQEVSLWEKEHTTPILPENLHFSHYYLSKQESPEKGRAYLLLCEGMASTLALDALHLLHKDAYSVDLLCLEKVHPSPLEDLRPILQNYEKIVTLELGVLQGGIGYSYAHYLQSLSSHPQILCLGFEETIIPQATVEEQLQMLGLDPLNIYKKCKAFFGEKK